MPVRALSVLAAVLLAVPLGGAGEASAQPGRGPLARHEIWAVDQGTGVNRIHVYDERLREVAVIALGDVLLTPHMIDFDSEYRYAFVAGTAGQGVAIIRTADYEVVDVVRTGAGAHMAAVTPDDASVWVANIGAQTFTEITLDLDNEVFAVGRELAVTSDPLWQAEFAGVSPPAAPVCHEYTLDGRFAYVTLGPAAHSGGVIVVDIASAEPTVVKAFSRDDVKANCGLARSRDGAKIYANWGDPGPAENPPEQTGEWYVFDTGDHSLIKATDETRGIDAHGTRITPDGRELWQVNRGSDNGIVVDTTTDEIIAELDFAGNGDLGPDIIGFSPDGRRAYVSLRGPHPVTGAPHVATGSIPGFAVFDVASRQLIDIVEPAKGTPEHAHSDFHGIRVRVIDTGVPGAGCAHPRAHERAGEGLGKGRAAVPDHVGNAGCRRP